MNSKMMMLGAAALGLLSSAPALAQDATYQVTGTIAPTCNAGSGGTIAFGTIAIDATGKVSSNQGADSGASAANVWCNGVNATMGFAGATVTNGVAVVPSGFTRTLSFTPEVKIGLTTYTALTGNAIGLTNAPITVYAKNLTSGANLAVAGSYTGTVVVTLTPGS